MPTKIENPWQVVRPPIEPVVVSTHATQAEAERAAAKHRTKTGELVSVERRP